jgi:DNA-binding SARP family transcriptional activator
VTVAVTREDRDVRLRVELGLLRDFQLRYDGTPVDLPGSAARLLAYLAIQDAPVRRAQAAATLWTDATDEHAGASLRSALWRLHRPGPALVTATATHVAIAPHVDVDLADSTRLARRLVGGSPLDERPGEDVVAALGADVLPGWYDDDWVVFSRERFRQLRLHALEALAGLLSSAGRFSEAVEAALAAVRVEPLRESAHRALVAVHLAEGNRSEAIRQYRTYARLLRDELGVAPSPALASLVGG